MPTSLRSSRRVRNLAIAVRWLAAAMPPACAWLIAGALACAAEPAPVLAAAESNSTAPITAGQRIFSCGHSFHAYWIDPILDEMAQAAGISGHQTVGTSKIGGSQVIQHWDVPDERNEAKKALRAGLVDVLTLSPMHVADEGIDRFAELARQGNPRVRVTIQEFWMPFDKNEWPMHSAPVDKDAMTEADLKALHDPYFAAMDAYVRGINAKAGRQELFVVPVGQAVIALRARIIAGSAPGIAKQSDLFSDPTGHPMPPLQALAAYCHFAVIYRRSPVGLPMPSVLSGPARNFAGNYIEVPGKAGWDERLNQLLQELAWAAVTSHPLSGVPATK